MYTFNPCTWKTEASGFLWVQGQPVLQDEFQNGQGYAKKPKTKIKPTNKIF